MKVIQHHLPVALPCYDFTLVTNSTLVIFIIHKISSVISSHGVTGGVYKARERIHRSIADLRLLAIPPSCRRVAAYNPNWGYVCQIKRIFTNWQLFVISIVARV